MSEVSRLGRAIAAGSSVLCMGGGVIVACRLLTQVALLVIWDTPLSGRALADLGRWFVPLAALVGAAAVTGACASHHRPDVRGELWRILGRLVGTGALWLGLGTAVVVLGVNTWGP